MKNISNRNISKSKREKEVIDLEDKDSEMLAIIALLYDTSPKNVLQSMILTTYEMMLKEE